MKRTQAISIVSNRYEISAAEASEWLSACEYTTAIIGSFTVESFNHELDLLESNGNG